MVVVLSGCGSTAAAVWMDEDAGSASFEFAVGSAEGGTACFDRLLRGLWICAGRSEGGVPGVAHPPPNSGKPSAARK